MTTSIKMQLLHLGILVLLMLGCEQTDTNTVSLQNNINNSTKNDVSEKKRDFFSTDLVYDVSGISAIDTFELKRYIEVLGQPDSIRRGGVEIIREFGHDDYDLWYGKNWINAGHGYIFAADIKEAGISFNGIQVGDEQVKIETTFNISHSERDTIKVVNRNDDVLTFYLQSKIIYSISFWRPL